jgi:hypothetical protein
MIQQSSIRSQVADAAARLRDRKPSPTDTHPVLEDRLTALGATHVEGSKGNALSLLDDIEQAELCVIRGVLKDPSMALTPIPWAEVGERIWMPAFREICAQCEGALNGLSWSALPNFAANAGELAERSRGGLALLSPAAERRRALRILQAWLCVKLHDRGFRVDTEPGAAIRMARGGDNLDPESTVRDLAEGRASAASWSEQCQKLGLEVS